jgi:hypothetical protein
VVRRSAPYLRGRFARHFEFYVNPDFAGGTLVVQDAYVDTVFSPRISHPRRQGEDAVRVRAVVSGLESHVHGTRVSRPRSPPTATIGVQALGDLFGGLGQLSRRRDERRGGWQQRRHDNNDSKDVSAGW